MIPTMMLKVFLALSFVADTGSTLQEDDITLVNLADNQPGMRCDARYASANNFMGRPVPGYRQAKCLGTPELAKALQNAAAALIPQGYGLIIYDAYRPQRAVDAFVIWTKDASDTVNKADYYPHVAKSQLIRDGYIADKSGHSRGGTVDLSLMDLKSGQVLDMGTSYDFFSPESSEKATGLTKAQHANRHLLRQVMMDAGFKPYWAEWWHFTLANEPWPNTYFNRPVE